MKYLRTFCVAFLIVWASLGISKAVAAGTETQDWQSDLHRANQQVSIYYSPFGAKPEQLNKAQQNYAEALRKASELSPTHPSIAIINLYWAGALLEPMSGPHASAALASWKKCQGDRHYQKQLAAAKSAYLLVLKAHHPADVAKFRAATI